MMWGWAISLLILTVCRSCTSGTVPGSEVIPSLDDILTKAADTIVGEYSISKDCKAVLTSVDENKCEIRIVAKPDGCITLNLLADKLLGSGSDTAQDIVSSLPSSVAIAEVRVDVCGEVLEITVTSTEPFTLIPGVVSVSYGGPLVSFPQFFPYFCLRNFFFLFTRLFFSFTQLFFVCLHSFFSPDLLFN